MKCRRSPYAPHQTSAANSDHLLRPAKGRQSNRRRDSCRCGVNLWTSPRPVRKAAPSGCLLLAVSRTADRCARVKRSIRCRNGRIRNQAAMTSREPPSRDTRPGVRPPHAEQSPLVRIPDNSGAGAAIGPGRVDFAELRPCLPNGVGRLLLHSQNAPSPENQPGARWERESRNDHPIHRGPANRCEPDHLRGTH